MRTVQSISITMPKQLIQSLDKLQEIELKGYSALISEAVRQYVEWKEYKNFQKELTSLARTRGIFSEGDIDKIIHSSR